MKKIAIFSLINLLISSSIFCQVSKDTLGQNNIYPEFYHTFSAEESWQIHKEAFKRKLGAKGFSKREIRTKMREYEKKKKEFSKNIEEQRKLAEKQMQIAEIQREKASEQLKLAETYRQKAEKLRQLAEIQRLKAEEQRKNAKEHRKNIKELIFENIKLSPKNDKEEIINVKIDNNGTLFFNINGYSNSGDVIVEIINPSGDQEGNLSLEHLKNTTTMSLKKHKNSSTSSFKSNASGSLNKRINMPEKGDWKIKIIPKNADGSINISVSQFISPAAK